MSDTERGHQPSPSGHINKYPLNRGEDVLVKQYSPDIGVEKLAPHSQYVGYISTDRYCYTNYHGAKDLSVKHGQVF